MALAALTASAADIEEVRDWMQTGRYAEVVEAAGSEARSKPYSEQWPLLAVRSMMALGRYGDALAIVTHRLAEQSGSIQLRWEAREVFRMNNQPERAAEMSQEILQLVGARAWSYRDARDLVAFGRAALSEGADPKLVLTRVFEPAKKAEPELAEPYQAIGELALSKHDGALAARTLQEGLAKHPGDPDLQCALARAYARSETTLMLTALESALKRNSNHVSSLLQLAEHALDCEDYAGAARLLDRAAAVNPRHPETWAYRAVLAHLQHEPEKEAEARDRAMQPWSRNPRVPHLIGRKLSEHYRFAEGSLLQREALTFDPGFQEARGQLAQDLLRLGESAEGWQLAQTAHDRDGYDVAALNLVTLRDTMAGFASVTNAHFVVRMTPREASLYGARALALLEEAREALVARYGLELAAPVEVDLFAEQKDFAVRTFGMPENHGFLGVCFGRVITANGPAARPGQLFNWEAMLWHEFTHVVTLQLTRNRMPRWLSEGISVYEERRANPAWGERLGPRYREMILGDDLTPVSELSGAFLAPRSAVHLQFAYYECSLVVEYLVAQYGFESLRAILRDLGQGDAVPVALTRHTAPMVEFERGFEAFARALAGAMGPGLDWTKPGRSVAGALAERPALELGAAGQSTNYWALLARGARLVEAQRWAEAKELLEPLAQAYADPTGPDGGLRLLAAAYRGLGDSAGEQRVWEQLAEVDDTAVDAYERLMELGEASGDWGAVVANVARYRAVNPLVPLPYRAGARAAEALGDAPGAILAYRALLQLDPPNPAELHYRLARQLHRAGDTSAREHLLLALEEAPRYDAALRLLLELRGSAEGEGNAVHQENQP